MGEVSRSRARACLLWGLALFLGVQVGALIWQEAWQPELREPEYGHKLAILQERLAAEPERPLVLVLGSSRTEIGLRPALLPLPPTTAGRTPLVFNFGLPGTGPLGELLCLHRLLRQGIRPARVLIEVLPPVLHDDARWEDRIDPHRLAWSDLGVLNPHVANSRVLYWNWVTAHLAPCFSSRLVLMNRIAPTWLPGDCRQEYIWTNVDAYGWMDCHFKPDDPAAYARRLARVHREYAMHFTGFRVSPVPDGSLRELLDLCRREGIPVTLFTMPESSDFRSWYAPAVRAEVDDYLSGLTRQYGVALIDTRCWLSDAAFYDGHHLHTDGARIFSERFAREVLGPLLSGER
jgi:hypothetical protein